MIIIAKHYKKIKEAENCKFNCCCYSIVGLTGLTGPAGSSGSALNYADFYALMPPYNSVTVALGTDVSFLHDGSNSDASITRTGAS